MQNEMTEAERDALARSRGVEDGGHPAKAELGIRAAGDPARRRALREAVQEAVCVRIKAEGAEPAKLGWCPTGAVRRDLGVLAGTEGLAIAAKVLPGLQDANLAGRALAIEAGADDVLWRLDMIHTGEEMLSNDMGGLFDDDATGPIPFQHDTVQQMATGLRGMAGAIALLYDAGKAHPGIEYLASEVFTRPAWRWFGWFAWDRGIWDWLAALRRAAVQSRLASSPAAERSEVWVRSDEASVMFEKDAGTIRKAAKRLEWRIEKAGSMNAYRLSDLESYFRTSLRKPKN